MEPLIFKNISEINKPNDFIQLILFIELNKVTSTRNAEHLTFKHLLYNRK